MVFNPVPTAEFSSGDVIVLIGKKGELERMSAMIC